MNERAPLPTLPFEGVTLRKGPAGVATMRVSITIIRAIVDELRRRGVRETDLLELAGIDPEELADATSRIPVACYERAVSAALSLASDPSLGLQVAWAAPAGALHVVGHLLVNCPTMRDAIE